MNKTRDNHYVPQWYQKGFLLEPNNQLYYLNLQPDTKQLPNGKLITMNECRQKPTTKCFYTTDLYTTFFGEHINDDIERILFGEIDDIGAKAIRAFTRNDPGEWVYHFSNFFEYLDAQKIRTPKGLDWINSSYSELNQNQLMIEMQSIRNMHGTIWTEGVREVVSAKDSDIKFIISDHPITIYNHHYTPDSQECIYPNDPSIALVSSQTIFPLDLNHCLILTNYEYADKRNSISPTEKRTNARNFGHSMVKTDNLIKSRILDKDDVTKINYIIKKRAKRYIAAPKKEWLYPEKDINLNWADLRNILLPPKNELAGFGGEMYIGYEDGSTHYQDAFGRTEPENKYLKKTIEKKKITSNSICGCGSGKKYKKCCEILTARERPTWESKSIRERNLMFSNGITNILGLNEDKTWDDIRKELSNEQVKKIHEVYGFLWPKDTDIISLLPKSNKTLRAVYTGVIDIRTIHNFVISMVPYFDEIIIQNPFMNPNFIIPKFNPVENPHQYKLQTLKNIALLFTLMPYIENGYINFIPDISNFNQHLQKQMLNMAEERIDESSLHGQDLRVIEQLQKDDIQRDIYMYSEEQQKVLIKDTIPDISDEDMKVALDDLYNKKISDPFCLLQDNILGEKRGQFTMLNMSPNFEISLFLSQITRSILVTDNSFRWEEIKKSQNKEYGLVVSNWTDIINHINNLAHPLNTNTEATLKLRKFGKFHELREILRNIKITSSTKPTRSKKKRLKKEYDKALKKATLNTISPETQINGKFTCIIPVGGITHNNVQRMLLSTGNDNYMSNVPMAIYVENV